MSRPDLPSCTFIKRVYHHESTASRGLCCRLKAADKLFNREAGKIKLLRETFNPLTMAQAQLPNRVADVGPPGAAGHSF